MKETTAARRAGLSCFDLVAEAVADEAGNLNIALDTTQERVAFDYDPTQVSGADVERIAAQISEPLQARWEKCSVRLDRHGGRACEACAMALERRVEGIAGVRRATASYIGGVLTVTYNEDALSPEELIQQVRRLGVGVAPAGHVISATGELPARPARVREWLLGDRAEAVFTGLALVGMAGGWIAERLGAPLAAAAFFSIAYVFGGFFGVRASIESLRDRTIDVDLLMVLAAVGAAVVGEPFEGALLLFLFSLSNVLQNFALDRTRNAIRALMKLRPEQALVRRGGRKVTLPIERLVVGDRMIVRPGERLALDGEIVEGETTVDQSPITGESMPVARTVGDEVLAGTINQQGSLEVRVTRLASESTIAKLIQLVEEAQSEKARTQRFIDRFEQYYASGVILFTLIAVLVPVFVLREAFDPVFYRAMTILVAASPCALVISTPASILSAIGNGARRGVLFKGGAYVEQAAAVRVVAFDKTGTLTEGKPRVTDVTVTDKTWMGDENSLLALAAGVESRSEHPLARAIVQAATARDLPIPESTAFQAATGMGARATVDGEDVFVGSARFLEPVHAAGLDAARGAMTRLEMAGQTAVAVARLEADTQSAQVVGVIGIADVLRSNAALVVRELKRTGVEHVAMLTGDNRRVAEVIGGQAGVDHTYSELLPRDKLRLVRELEAQYGPVAMVGDGVNDAPALAMASLGIAMGAAGTDVALETADVVLMSDDLSRLPYLIALSRQTRRTLVFNLVFAMSMIALMLAGIFLIQLPLPLAVVGHEGGTVLVSLNGLRLLGFRYRG
ncbi:MAG: heavy metal translocating P-type ATPase [Anaerolineales bacterium]